MKLSPTDFFKKYAPYAMDTQNKYGIPASITLAQAALESGWGGSELTVLANNFFGIKVPGNPKWYGKSINMATGEVFNGVSQTINSDFRKYDSALDSFNDHASFLLGNKRYSSLFTIPFSDPYYFIKWAQGLKAAGYATATNYDTTLISMINKYKLTEYDKQAVIKKKILIAAGLSLVIIVIIGTIYILLKKDK